MQINRDDKSARFQTILEKRYTRRKLFELSAILTGPALLSSCSLPGGAFTSSVNLKIPEHKNSLLFKELPHSLDKNFTVAEGYQFHVILAWGDPLFTDAPGFDPCLQSEQNQLQQFGYNNDFVGFVSLPVDSKNSNRGLLVVNHETTQPELMFPNSPKGNNLNREQTLIDIAAHGLSVVEINKTDQGWSVIRQSIYNRRITPNTEMLMSGPAAGSERLKTLFSDDGIHTLGTYGNCAGGVTPWGTVLTGEENVDDFFYGEFNDANETKSFQSFNVEVGAKNWGEHYQRWNLEHNPGELLHMGWIVEIDPFDPQSVPLKRTALGRLKHEGANVIINQDGRAVVYMGDDEAFQCIYRFVSKNTYQEGNRKQNLHLLDEGELSVACFNEDGSLRWLPLVYGEGPLTEEQGFKSQADVVIDARIAARLVGATSMDRPEDVDINLVNGRVYAMLTNNNQRTREELDAANPRSLNEDGQIIEFWPENGNHGTTEFKWDIFLLAGDPAKVETTYNPDISENGWLSCPDNCAFDLVGNLWIATDGAHDRGIADGLWATEVDGKNKALTKRFARTPFGAEMCGPFFTPNSETLFCAIQHPALGSNFNNPSTRWPDFDKNLPPRPAVVAITKIGGGRVGS